MIYVGRFTVHPAPPRILSSRRVSLVLRTFIHPPLFLSLSIYLSLSLFLLSVSLLVCLEEPNSAEVDPGGQGPISFSPSVFLFLSLSTPRDESRGLRALGIVVRQRIPSPLSRSSEKEEIGEISKRKKKKEVV